MSFSLFGKTSQQKALDESKKNKEHAELQRKTFINNTSANLSKNIIDKTIKAQTHVSNIHTKIGNKIGTTMTPDMVENMIADGIILCVRYIKYMGFLIGEFMMSFMEFFLGIQFNSQKNITAEEYLKQYSKRIEIINSILNAILTMQTIPSSIPSPSLPIPSAPPLPDNDMRGGEITSPIPTPINNQPTEIEMTNLSPNLSPITPSPYTQDEMEEIFKKIQDFMNNKINEDKTIQENEKTVQYQFVENFINEIKKNATQATQITPKKDLKELIHLFVNHSMKLSHMEMMEVINKIGGIFYYFVLFFIETFFNLSFELLTPIYDKFKDDTLYTKLYDKLQTASTNIFSDAQTTAEHLKEKGKTLINKGFDHASNKFDNIWNKYSTPRTPPVSSSIPPSTTSSSLPPSETSSSIPPSTTSSSSLPPSETSSSSLPPSETQTGGKKRENKTKKFKQWKYEKQKEKNRLLKSIQRSLKEYDNIRKRQYKTLKKRERNHL
jgi:hypothetical protein